MGNEFSSIQSPSNSIINQTVLGPDECRKKADELGHAAFGIRTVDNSCFTNPKLDSSMN